MAQVTKILVLIPLILGLNSTAHAKSVKKAEHQHSEKHSHKEDKATAEFKDSENLVIKVNGMVCAFCAQGVEKQFNSRDEVESTKVNLDTMEVNVKLKKGKQLSEDVIKKLVTDAGFSFVGLKK